MITLLAATVCAVASDSQVPGPRKLMWNEIPMTDASRIFDGYVTPEAPIDSPAYLKENIVKYFNELIMSVPKPIARLMQATITNLAQSFVNQVDAALQDTDINNSRKKLVILQGYLESTGKFLAKMYDDVVSKPVWITSEVALRGTTFGSEYRKEYFLVDENDNKIDNEKNDGKFYFFYSEPTPKPGILRILGLGYVDKRSWKKYLFEKVKYPALIGALGYGAYKGSQTERGQRWMESVRETAPYKSIAESQAGQWAGENIPLFIEGAKTSVSHVLSQAKEFPGYVQNAFVGYFSEKDKDALESINNKQADNNKQMSNAVNEQNKILSNAPVGPDGSVILTKKDENRLDNLQKKQNVLREKDQNYTKEKEEILNNASPVVTKDPEFKSRNGGRRGLRAKPQADRRSGVGTSGVVTRTEPSPRYLSTPEELRDHLARKRINERQARRQRWF